MHSVEALIQFAALSDWQPLSPGSVGLAAAGAGAGLLIGLLLPRLRRRKPAADLPAIGLDSRPLLPLADSLPVFLAYIDAGGIYRFNNRKYADWFGRPVGQITGRPVKEVMGAEAYERVRKPLEEAMTGKPIAYDMCAADAGGIERWLRVEYLPDIAADGTVRGVTSIVIDDTQERTISEEYRVTFEVAGSGKALVDPATGRYLRVNRKLCEMTGYSRDELTGLTFSDITHPDDRDRDVAAYREAISSGVDEWSREKRYIRKDGRIIWVHVTGAVLRDDDGQPLRSVAVIQDVTQRREQEQILADSEHRLREALHSERAARRQAETMRAQSEASRAHAEAMNRLKDEFLATLSHELRTPLNAILGWSEILRRAPSPEDLPVGLEAIGRNARAQAQLVDDLLDMSRIVAGRVRLDVKPVDPAVVAAAAIETVRPAANARSIRLEESIDDGVSWVNADPGRLQQIIWNLLSNAVKFTQPGGLVKVEIHSSKACSCTGDGTGVSIVVSDTGQGIDPQFLPHVFERFRQGDGSTTRAIGGLGLGLAIVKQLVELHGGVVSADSEGPDKGSRFTVCLPARQPAAPAAPDHPIPERSRSAPVVKLSSPAESELAGVKVLVVDDDRDALEIASVALGRRGAEVVLAASTDEALGVFERFAPDVLLSDIGMPGADGYELIRRVRALGPTRGGNVAAGALTAFARADDRARALEAGYQVHIPKPIEPSGLANAVAALAQAHA